MRIQESILQQIYKTHKRSLKNLSVKNPKVIITFSGIPGSGKTYIAKRLERYFKAVRINSDRIRNIIKKEFPNKFEIKEINELTTQYILYLANKLKSSKNHLLIFDSSIDRKFKLIRNYAKDNKYKLIVICLKISEKTIISRIKKRNKDNSETFLKYVDKWIHDQDIFLLKNTPDITLDTSRHINWDKLYTDIEKLIKSKHSKKISKTDKLVRTYLLHESFGNPNKSPYFDAWEEVHEIVFSQPNKAWIILIKLIEKASSDKILCNIGAGPLETFLSKHGEKYIKEVEDQARKDRKFYFALSCVWQSTMTEEVWSRVQQAIELRT